MITLIEARTPLGTLLSMDVEGVETGFVIQNIDGLDPVNASIVSSSYASIDGAQYQFSRRDTRNIVMTIGMESDFITASVRDLRTQLYSFFMPETQVSLRFYMDDGLVVNTSGRVESFVAPLFTDEPNAVISIICFDPDFLDATPVILSGSTESSTTDTYVNYDGTSQTGFTFVLNVNRSLTEFTIYNRTSDNVVRILDFAATLQADDVLTISTIPGSKSITLVRAGITSSLLYGMTSQSDWLTFLPGDNYIRVYATGAAIPYELTYTTRYGGL